MQQENLCFPKAAPVLEMRRQVRREKQYHTSYNVLSVEETEFEAKNNHPARSVVGKSVSRDIQGEWDCRDFAKSSIGQGCFFCSKSGKWANFFVCKPLESFLQASGQMSGSLAFEKHGKFRSEKHSASHVDATVVPEGQVDSHGKSLID